jgi:polyhydroxyalkanoate synthesis regulator phasin
MAGLGDWVQKAVYLGVGIASYGMEKAGMTLQELKTQTQKLADEMVARGEMTAEEARRYVDDIVQQAQQQVNASPETNENKEPRPIEIILEDEEPTSVETDDVDHLRKQVESLQEELRNLKRE